MAELHQFVQEKGVSAIVGTPYFEEGKLYNSIVVLLTDGRKLLYHKQNLVDYEEVYFEPGRKQLVFEYKGLPSVPLSVATRTSPFWLGD